MTTKATFIIDKEQLEVLKTYAKYKRQSQKDLLADILGRFFQAKRKDVEKATKACGGRGLWPVQERAAPKLELIKADQALETQAIAARRSTWESYAMAYAERVGQQPVRNAKSNALIRQFVDRIGQAESPEVIRFFVHHPDGRYISRLYMLELAVKDAESLRSQWANHKPFTKSDVKHFESAHARVGMRERIARGEI